MDVGHLLIGKNRLGPRHHLCLRDDTAGAVNDTVIGAVALDQVIGGARQNLWHRPTCVPCAMIRTQEDRPGLGIGLRRGEGAVGQDQHLCPFGDVVQAVAAGVAAAVGHGALGLLAIGVRAATLQGADKVCGEGGDLGHGGAPLLPAPCLNRAAAIDPDLAHPAAGACSACSKALPPAVRALKMPSGGWAQRRAGARRGWRLQQDST